MKRSRWHWFVAVLLGIVAGLGSAAWSVGAGQSSSLLRLGPWQTDTLTGSVAAGAHTRAAIALHGLLALNSSEAVYYTAFNDSSGEPLRQDCRYRIDGAALPAPWWSLTLYAQDEFLARNTDQAHAVNRAGIVRDEHDHWQITVAAERGDAANWLSTRAAGRFSISLRLYRPQSRPQAEQLPTITRLGCEATA
ncbi:DUF1214 domain-containing protein [Hydrocarboniphaga sp.]|uniref:DUF1214 domain-containing protein n=1 Tax=Hydrocarboniphaga sp. TaxID=2033016 RepID=UPI003D0CE746